MSTLWFMLNLSRWAKVGGGTEHDGGMKDAAVVEKARSGWDRFFGVCLDDMEGCTECYKFPVYVTDFKDQAPLPASGNSMIVFDNIPRQRAFAGKYAFCDRIVHVRLMMRARKVLLAKMRDKLIEVHDMIEICCARTGMHHVAYQLCVWIVQGLVRRLRGQAWSKDVPARCLKRNGGDTPSDCVTRSKHFDQREVWRYVVGHRPVLKDSARRQALVTDGGEFFSKSLLLTCGTTTANYAVWAPPHVISNANVDDLNQYKHIKIYCKTRVSLTRGID